MKSDWLESGDESSTARHTLSTVARDGWVRAALCMTLALAACSEEANPGDGGRGRGESASSGDDANDDDEVVDDDDAVDDDDDGDSSDEASQMGGRDASQSSGGRNDAGGKDTLIDAGMDDPSDDSSSPDGGGSDVDDSEDIVLPSPNELGPYEVTEKDNVGEGFETEVNTNDRPGTTGGFCLTFISLFGQDAQTNEEYAAVPDEYNMALYTLYHPSEMKDGQKFPVLSWANGTCAHTVGYVDMIKHVVSHGFIVIAPHSRFTGSGEAQIKGIDWVIDQNDDPESPLYQHVDTEKVGLFGHSQGGGSTGVASRDPRVDTSILMHGGTGANLHAPALFLTGEMDNPAGPRGRYDSSDVPAAFGNLKMSNHITMMTEHERMAPEVVAWFRYQLLDDAEARSWFVGDDCVLCTDSEWEYASKDLE